MNETNDKLYEVSFLAKNENGIATMGDQIVKFSTGVVSEEAPKKINLSYPIANEKSAYFGYTICKLLPDSIEKINEAIKLDGDILRVLITAVETSSEKGMERAHRTSPTDPEAAAQKPTRKTSSAQDGIVPNELLEEKLEEILQ